ncbi:MULTISPECIES: XrtA/PEP-CTERM system-associated ATPase [unclassified Sphingopyxis]|jgi:putative secretion ATPase (PEP-CTERM system associated)|uniref:XrtA/PEP-CTERM system-associated ATPase n=1 Tax=unclassified Sphingopyxis TaxID=2614943 RepID=UPI0006C1CE17|nr:MULTISPECIES: XrtA/PEP-CTERM system-associated ATPase [unclassified Sphingopyxis]USI75689.1 XrtA-associated ATPase [Sphingopyxis sp. USTB-05]GAO77794.1 AAA ATPase [Sphingopyxis sp. C-1]
MYDQFYGFTGRPFQLTPDPHFYFESGTHRKAMSYLGYGLAQGEGFIVITGDVGAGKTTLVGHLMNTIDPNRLTAVKLVSTQVEGDDLLRLVAEQFGIEWEGQSKAEMLRSMEEYLREQARAGRRTLLIVDEGQNLAISALEELRMLSNFQLGGHSLLQIFLLGQPEFRQTLFHSPTLEQLRQRVIATHHLDPMEPEEVEPYILHRLGKVGWTGNPSFSPDAFEEIFDYSEGVPRKLNVLVSRLLLYGAVEQMNRITAQNVRSVIAEIEADRGIDASTLAPLPVDEIVAAAATAVAPTPAPFVAPTAANETAREWPQRVAAAPVAAATAPFAAPTEPAPVVTPTPSDAAPAAPTIDPEQLATLEKQIASLEERLVEQDAALRRVLDLLIEWVERDPDNAPNPANSRTWAA